MVRLPFILKQAYACLGHKRGGFPQAEVLADRMLLLYPELIENQINRVTGSIRRFFPRAGRS
jgi:hypothetical protein